MDIFPRSPPPRVSCAASTKLGLLVFGSFSVSMWLYFFLCAFADKPTSVYTSMATPPELMSWDFSPPIELDDGTMHYRFGVIADLDKKSSDKGKKPSFHSFLKFGVLVVANGDTGSKNYSIRWEIKDGTEHVVRLTSPLNEAGRGMELSALTPFNNRLYSMDDRSGIVFEISRDYDVIARHILMEGDGNNGKGFKVEWATQKDGLMYVGSFGKEYTNMDGTIKNKNNQWIKTIDQIGRVVHIDWSRNYEILREATNTQFPSYLIIEAIEWSQVHRRWFILPRRVSHEPYVDDRDEKMGSNIMITANEDFSDVEIDTIGTITPERGFSAFKFVPGTQDSVILYVKSMESEALQTQESYISAYTVGGQVLVPEVKFADYKYEGLAFV